MERFNSNHSNSCKILLLLLVMQISSKLATGGSVIKSLPGFHGPLPFVLETGYVGVGEKEDEEVFYYFIESENNPKEDPLMLWLTGGPGCSSFSGFVMEIGPLAFKIEEYNGSLPNLILRPHSWTKVSSIIFVDLPVGTGFSYSKTKDSTLRSDWKMVHHAHQFLRKWLIDHPEFQTSDVYIGGDSYSGIAVPVIVQEILNGNEEGVQPRINLQGYVLGNPLTTGNLENYRIPFARGHGLISNELYESLQQNCKGEYINIDSKSGACLRDMASYSKSVSGLSRAHILQPLCEYVSPKPLEIYERRSLTEKLLTSQSSLTLPPLYCLTYPYFLSIYWANDEHVRKALHVKKGSIGKWKRCDSSNFQYEIPDSFQYHVNLSKRGCRSLIYSGDHDLVVPFLETEAWVKSLNYSIVDDWRQWHVNGQIAGYTRTYSSQMTFATVKGGGHTAPEYKPEECFAMWIRWISNKPL